MLTESTLAKNCGFFAGKPIPSRKSRKSTVNLDPVNSLAELYLKNYTKIPKTTTDLPMEKFPGVGASIPLTDRPVAVEVNEDRPFQNIDTATEIIDGIARDICIV